MKNGKRRSEICPHCEEGILQAAPAARDIPLGDSCFRLPNVLVEHCRECGFESVSGREAALFEMLFSSNYSTPADLVRSIRAAGYHEMFLKESDEAAPLAFASTEYVAGLSEDLRTLYLDSESHLLITRLSSLDAEMAVVEAAGRSHTVRLPRIGEGENSFVYEYPDAEATVLKVAKPRHYCRQHLQMEREMAGLFLDEGIAVPRVIETDTFGRFLIKERIPGKSLARVYPELGEPDSENHKQVRRAVKEFIAQVLSLFERSPRAKASLSPTNIFVLDGGGSCRCFLVDTGPAPFHDYSGFDFERYWNEIIPEKLRQYGLAGYI